MKSLIKICLAALVTVSLLSACGEKAEVSSLAPAKIVTTSIPGSTVVTPTGQATAAKAIPLKTHKVKKGEFLNAIADHYNMEREALILANSKMLIERFEDTCLRTQEKAQKSKSLFCNEDYKRAWANTLLPGWIVQIPDASQVSSSLNKTFGPEKVQALSSVVTSLADVDSLAILLDVSGSMDSKRQGVAQYVMETLRKNGKKFGGLYVYSENVKSIKDAISDEKLRKALTNYYPETGAGSVENTHKALKYVLADKKATHILVISDEVGDDWGWSTVKDMKNIIAVCVAPTASLGSCGGSFQHLAKDVPGSKYIPL